MLIETVLYLCKTVHACGRAYAIFYFDLIVDILPSCYIPVRGEGSMYNFNIKSSNRTKEKNTKNA